MSFFFCFSSRRRHTRCALVTGVQTCALPIFHLTIMPYIEDIAFPALAKSGYQTLLPDVEGAAFWAEQLGLPQAPSVMANMFGEVLSLASELGAMDQKRLGNETDRKSTRLNYSH